ncbi:DnaA ATPase domain-containing protein [Bdellovibrio bacteriovorus]|uniref:DnaA ATPase domain-containing protein n=1 Tax=Bdellovibrio bacteriovorus TaxID=959 RepID=UPI003A80F1B0
MQETKTASIGADQSFPNFIVGPYNDAAVRICRAVVASSSGQVVYVKGGVGSGKTHLFSALKMELEENGSLVKMLSGERLCRMLSNGQGYDSLKAYDVLMLDQVDIFRHFQDLRYQLTNLLDSYIGKKILINGDQDPKDNQILKEWWENHPKCTLVELFHPDYVDRVKMVSTLCQWYGLSMNEKFIHFTAKVSERSIRALVGEVKKWRLLKSTGMSELEIEQA